MESLEHDNIEVKVELEVDELVQEILYRCHCLDQQQHLLGVKKDAFLSFTLEDIHTRLPDTVHDREAAKKIFDEITAFKNVSAGRAKEGASSNDRTAGSSETLPDLANNVSSDSDDETIILPVRTEKPAPMAEVTLESSDSDAETVVLNLPRGVNGNNPEPRRRQTRARRAAAQKSNYEEFFWSDDSSSNESEPEAKKARKGDVVDGVWTVKNPKVGVAKLRGKKDFLEDCVKVKIVPDDIHEYHHICVDEPPPHEIEEWVQFFTLVGKTDIKALDLHMWSWQSISSTCPFNLNKILSKYSPKLEDVSLSIGAVEGAVDKSAALGTSLKNLRRLTIKHNGKIQYMDQLKSILRSAKKLEKIEYWFWDYEDLESVLNILVGFEDRDCQALRVFTMRSYNEGGYLKKNHLEAISKIRMTNLEVLEIGNGYWEDCRAIVVEKMLKSFQYLTSVTMHGNFQGDSLHKPDIVINVPALSYLKSLSMGADYEFESTDESLISRTNRGNENVIVISEESTKELFSVSVKLPLLLQLETLALGNMYKVDDLHFASLKSLKTFRVGSPWHLSVIFPPENSRNNSYPLVTELQLPDCLKDPYFVTKIPQRFPNLKKCRIYLPSVIVLRTFLMSMQHSKLESLILKTQFDFPSSLEACLAPKRKLLTGHLDDELINQDLLDYDEPMRKKFIDFHNIQLPLTEKEIRDLEDDGSYDGINSLKHLRFLHMEHIPRRLRIPKGSLHWTHHQAEFTSHYIGFMQYPVTDKSLKTMSIKHLEHPQFPNFHFRKCTEKVLLAAGYTKSKGAGADTFATDRKRTLLRETVPVLDMDEDVKPIIPAHNKNRGKLKVKIRPAMLEANFRFKGKDEKN